MTARYQFVATHAGQYPVAILCRVLGVARSGFYAWRRRTESARRQGDRHLTEHIQRVHAASRATYGSPRVHAELRSHGLRCAEKRVARLMRQAGLRATSRRRRPVTTMAQPGAPVAMNLLQRDFTATAPNQKWAADITYVATQEGWLYLAVVLDLWSRRVVGWAMQATLEHGLVHIALEMALAHRELQADVIHHSDRGSQYTSTAYQARLATAGIRCSMSRRGDCYDNAAVESFFSTLKREVVTRVSFPTRQVVRQAIFEYIEVFYNRQRRHSTLGYMSPVTFETYHQRDQWTAVPA